MATTRYSLVHNRLWCDDTYAVISIIHDAKNTEDPNNAFILLENIGKLDSFVITKVQLIAAKNEIVIQTIERKEFLDHFKESECYALSFQISCQQPDYLINAINLFDIKELKKNKNKIEDPYGWAKNKIINLPSEIIQLPNTINEFKTQAWYMGNFTPYYLTQLASSTVNLASSAIHATGTTLLSAGAGTLQGIFSLFYSAEAPKKEKSLGWLLHVILDWDPLSKTTEPLLLLQSPEPVSITTFFRKQEKIPGRPGKYEVVYLLFHPQQLSSEYYQKTYEITEEQADHFMEQRFDESDLTFKDRGTNVAFNWVKKIILNIFPEEEDNYLNEDTFKACAQHIEKNLEYKSLKI